MSESSSLTSGVIGGVSFATIGGIAWAIYKLVNHTACRSRCCGRKIEVSLDIDRSPYADMKDSPVKAPHHKGKETLSSIPSVPSIRIPPTDEEV